MRTSIFTRTLSTAAASAALGLICACGGGGGSSSRPEDIKAGATAIAPAFIVGGGVTGKIVNATGHTMISDTVACRVRFK